VAFSWSSAASESQAWTPCHGENCINATLYLGPQWGSRVISLPKPNSTNEVPRPQHRPVPPGEEFQVDFGDDTPVPNTIPAQNLPSNVDESQWSWRDPEKRRNSENISDEVSVIMDEYGMGVLDLSYRRYSGTDRLIQ
jgi:hypothetical protein